MFKPSASLAASLALAALLAGCSPNALQAAVQAGLAANGGASAAPGTGASAAPGALTGPGTGASAAPGASTGPGTGASTAPGTSASTAPGTTASPGANPSPAASTGSGATATAAPTTGASPATAAVAGVADAFMDAVDAAAAQDPEMVMRLFVTGLATYNLDQDLGRAMMGYALRPGLRSESPSSPTGFFPQAADSIYFRSIEKNTQIGRFYLADLAAGDLPFAEMAKQVVIDAEYKAVDKGLSANGKEWTWFLKVNHPNNVRSRPIRVAQDPELGWRVSNYSSLMVSP